MISRPRNPTAQFLFLMENDILSDGHAICSSYVYKQPPSLNLHDTSYEASLKDLQTRLKDQRVEERLDVVLELLRGSFTPSERRDVVAPVLYGLFVRDFIVELPREICFYILDMLDASDLCKMRLVSHDWCSIIESNCTAWKRFCVAYGFDAERISEHNVRIGRSSDADQFPVQIQSRRRPQHKDKGSEINWCGTFLEGIGNEYMFKKGEWKFTSYSGHTGRVTSLDWLPVDIVSARDGFLISGAYDRTLRVWDVKTGRCEKTFVTHTISDLRYILKHNIVVTGSYDSSIRLWHIDTGECLGVCRGHTGSVFCISVQEDNEVLVYSGSADGTVKCWGFGEEGFGASQCRCEFTVNAHEGEWVVEMALRKSEVASDFGVDVGDHVLVSASNGGTIKVWNAEHSCFSVTTILPHNDDDGSFSSLTYNGSIISASFKNAIKIFETRKYRWIQRFPITETECLDVDRMLLVTCMRRQVRVSNRHTGKTFFEASVPTSTRIYCVKIFGTKIALGSENSVFVLEFVD